VVVVVGSRSCFLFVGTVKIRGQAQGDLIHRDFFIIIDRLVETLGTRMKKWQHQAKAHRGVLGRWSKNRKILEQQWMIDRLTVAYDIASAFWYLHEQKYVA
jgi:hypothetical protein